MTQGILFSPRGVFFNGEPIELRPGESPGDAARRLQTARTKQSGKPAQTQVPAVPAKPVPSKTALVGTREWGACLIEQFGAVNGARFIAEELTYMEALDEAVRLHLTATGKLPAPPSPAAVAAPPKTAHGFASKIKINRGSFNAFKKKK